MNSKNVLKVIEAVAVIASVALAGFKQYQELKKSSCFNIFKTDEEEKTVYKPRARRPRSRRK